MPDEERGSEAQFVAAMTMGYSDLHDYLNGRGRPDLPTRHKDMAGRLMSDLQYAVTHLDDRRPRMACRSTTPLL